MMGAIKLQAIGNSFGFRMPQESLKTAGFTPSDEYEFFSQEGVIVILKRLPHHSRWTFEAPKMSAEDRDWVDAKL
jgi:antitoxin component of MazEF toxin-antitoxin module